MIGASLLSQIDRTHHTVRNTALWYLTSEAIIVEDTHARKARQHTKLVYPYL
jgi:hypothetical protein